MKRLTCGCCGEAALGKQHWNQDTGFGLCARCVPVIANNPRAGEEELRGYGTAGVNYAKPLSHECQPGMLVSWSNVGDDLPHVGTLKEWDNGTAVVREHVRWMTGEEDKEVAVRGGQ